LVSKINNLSSNLNNKTASSVMIAIVEEFGLKQFYKNQTNLSEEVDAASDYDILEIILCFAETFETVEQFYNYYLNPVQVKVEDSNDVSSNDKVDLTSIHKTKGNEYEHVAYYNLTSRITEKATDDMFEEERRIAYVAVTRPKKSLIVTTIRNEISPFIKELFLDPKYKGLKDQELRDKIADMCTKLITVNLPLKNIIMQMKDLNTKYPELKGKSVKVTGWLKGIRQSLRDVDVDIAQKKYNVLKSKEIAIIKNNPDIVIASNDIEIELKYREIIRLNGVSQTILSTNKKATDPVIKISF
jgi:hypothetical protein